LSYITDPQTHEVAAAELAVQGEIEKGELSGSLGKLLSSAISKGAERYLKRVSNRGQTYVGLGL
jgi:hypothetical protein